MIVVVYLNFFIVERISYFQNVNIIDFTKKELFLNENDVLDFFDFYETKPPKQIFVWGLKGGEGFLYLHQVQKG